MGAHPMRLERHGRRMGLSRARDHRGGSVVAVTPHAALRGMSRDGIGWACIDGALATSPPEATTQNRAGGDTVRTRAGSSVRPLQGLNSHP